MAKKKTAYDPVEEAKGDVVDRERTVRHDTPTVPTMPAAAASAPPPPPPATPPAAAAAPVRKRYRVKAKKQVILGGGLTHVQAGDIVTETGHGKDGIAKLIAQGVELEELK